MDLPSFLYEPIVRAALAEDVGAGDITTTVCVPEGTEAVATFYAKSPGVVAGLAIGALAFRILDPDATIEALVSDGAVVGPGKTAIARVFGDARALLTAERVALNFMQRLSGIATITARYVALTQGTKARIADTRKTTPGLRVLEKWAVRVGRGHNHRLGLYDSVMIKDNHIRAAGGIGPAVQAARARIPHTMKIEVEASNLEQVDDALAAGADIILLDNMDVAMLTAAAQRIDGRAIAEASGGITECTVAAVAATGVDIISVGALTHSAPALDISMDFTS
jgi:nicotinate-nucleotide pyrophosphorylase (carboxylating)